jgi:putative endonuclease
MVNLGLQGETFVANFLKNRGFLILATNFKSRFGEIDIIAQKGEVVAFVEVKSRKTYYFPISQAVTYGKQKKIIKTAKYYILTHNITNKACQFDVATVLYNNHDTPQIDYIENAFYGA